MRNRLLSVGLLFLVAVVATVGAIMRLRVPHGPVLYAELRTAPDLRDGARVSFRGVNVGAVTHIGFIPNAVRVTIALHRSDVPLRQGDSVRVRHNGALADPELELVPTTRPGFAVRTGDVLPEAAPDPASLRRMAIETAWLERIAHATGVKIGRDSGARATTIP